MDTLFLASCNLPRIPPAKGLVCKIMAQNLGVKKVIITLGEVALLSKDRRSITASTACLRSPYVN